MLRLVVCGDGSIAHSIALMCGYNGHSIRILTTNEALWARTLRGVLPDGQQIAAPIEQISRSPENCIPGSDIVLVCVPHADIPATLQTIAPYLSTQMIVGGIPGFGGFGIAARKIIPHVACIFGTQRIPFVIRDCLPGRNVTIGGIRRQTFVGTIPAIKAAPISEIVHTILGVLTVPVSHYINIELSPSNSIVNPARMFSLFAMGNRSPVPKSEFFTDWDIASSQVLLRLSDELQAGRMLLPRDTSFVAPILFQYDANDVVTLTKKFRGLTALAGRPVPVVSTIGNGVTIDPATAYVTEDIDLGLTLIRSVLRLAGATTSFADEIITWRSTLSVPLHASSPFNPAEFIESMPEIETLMRILD